MIQAEEQQRLNMEHSAEASGPDAVYVYAVCRADGEPYLDGLTGLTGDEPVRALSIGSLTAIIQTVPAADFTDEVWQERLADENELERYARAHHEVVSSVAARHPTVPLPLATLYNDEERAGFALAHESERFRTVLKRIAHHTEWGIKVYTPVSRSAGAQAPRERSVVPADRTRPDPGAGRAYLESKRNLQSQREQRQADSLRIADAVDADVCGIATASRRLRPHGSRAGGDHRVQVLNATYLIAEHRAAELRLLASSLRERTGAEIEVSGPWVPYSFVGEV